MIKFIDRRNSLKFKKCSHLDIFCDLGNILGPYEHLYRNRIRKVSYVKDKNTLFIPDISLIKKNYFAVNADFSELSDEIRELHSLIVKVPSEYNIRIIRPLEASAKISFSAPFSF